MSLPLEKFYVVITFEDRYLVVSKRQPYALMLLSPFRPTAIHSLSIPYTSSSLDEQRTDYLSERSARITLDPSGVAGQSLYLYTSFNLDQP